MNQAPFIVYDAAAGSGKTYTLVKEYLLKILGTAETDYYRYALAITFTNKAVAEMKSRIVKTLVAFSQEEATQQPSALMTEVSDTLGISPQSLQARSRAVLKHLLHHYAMFSVETIDHFNHRLLRTFARDLELPGNFEVSMDTDTLLAEAIDRLISRAGTDEDITALLIAFALEKTDDDKSWDIARDIENVASLLFSENDAAYLKQLQSKNLSDFSAVRQEVLREKSERSAAVMQLASETLNLIHANGLDKSHFTRGSFYNFLEKVSAGIFKHDFEAAWQRTLSEKNLYPGKTSKDDAARLDSISDHLRQSFYTIRESLFRLLLLDNVVKNLTPLSVVHEVALELEAIKDENNLLLISEFNSLIHESIKDQPAPFIYERLGEKYRHFFIDEFQDTSLLQWENLKPLISNALSQQYREGMQGSLLVVGDAKQSIYRWRGGLPEQFIELYSDTNPFPVQKEVAHLKTNYRSYSEIISFNNDFFQWVATHFQRPDHRELFKIGNNQKTNEKKGGAVTLYPVSESSKEALHEAYGAQVFATIQELLEDNYSLKDLCILCRTHKDGVQLSRYLLERDIPVVSSESLLLVQAPTVRFLVNTLQMLMDAEDLTAKAAWLMFLHDHFSVAEKEHDFVATHLNQGWNNLDGWFKEHQIDFNPSVAMQLSLYEMFAYTIHAFKLETRADNYVFHFMDLVFDFEQQPLAGKHTFLEFWEVKKEKASVSVPSDNEAVRVMTIHQSKGLEFTVVLFPYADMKLYDHRNAKTWYPWKAESPLDHVLLNYKKEVSLYGEEGEKIALQKQSTLELDHINLLYVTLTRAVERLYIYFQRPKKIKPQPQSFNELLAGYLEHQDRWDETSEYFRFGELLPKQQPSATDEVKTVTPPYYSTLPETHKLHAVSREALLWDTTPGEAIAWGDQLHHAMEMIRTEDDVDWVLEELAMRKTLPEADWRFLKQSVERIIAHPKLEGYFSDGNAQIELERDIITAEGRMLRPDRIQIAPNGEVAVMDYKTGAPQSSHKIQIEQYANALEAMGHTVTDKLIIYCSEQGITVNKT